jgi:TatD DNase family protein
MLIDTHCHLDFPQLSDEIDAVMARARQAGVGRMITISTRLSKAKIYQTLAETHPHVYFTIGTHPLNIDEDSDITLSNIVSLSHHPKCVGLGEAGLDYHYDKTARDHAQSIFRLHIEAARKTGLPLVIHSREADEDMATILSEEMAKGSFKAILHCFTSSAELARIGVSLGLYISFSGVLTFKNSQDLRDIAASIPLERLLVETDSPYLAPVPFRGKTNEPSYVAHTAAVLAQVHGVTPDVIAQQTTDNALRLFDKMPALTPQELALS